MVAFGLGQEMPWPDGWPAWSIQRDLSRKYALEECRRKNGTSLTMELSISRNSQTAFTETTVIISERGVHPSMVLFGESLLSSSFCLIIIFLI